MSEPYHKIGTLFERDPKTFKVKTGVYRDDVVKWLRDCEWHWEEKLDGTNVRVIWDGAVVSLRGRTDRAQMQPELLEVLYTQFPAEKMCETFGDTPVTLYGEGIGEKIQKGSAYCDGHKFVVFDVVINDTWLTRESVRSIGGTLGVECAPTVMTGTIDEAVSYISNTQPSLFAKYPEYMEGLIGRPPVRLQARNGSRLIVKLKTRDF